MSMNSLAIFKQLFLKHSKDIKDIFTNVSAFVEDKDRAIADFLSVEYSELIWLIRVLHIEYDKQFSPNISTQQHVVEKIARSITLTVDETDILDYGQKDHNNLIYNTLETHFLKSQNHTIQDNQARDDIISLDGSTSDMDLVYQHNIAFEDMAPHQGPQQPNKDDISLVLSTNVPSKQEQQPLTHFTNASIKTNQ